MKKWIAITVAALVAVPMCTAQIRDTYLNELLRKNEISLGEAAGAYVISEALGLDTERLFSQVQPYGSIYDYGPYLSLSRQYGYEFDSVARMRASGMGWGQIAKRIGMHPGEFNKLRNKGGFETHYWHNEVFRRYGYDHNDWQRAKSHGATLEDFVVSAVLSGRNETRFNTEIANRGKARRNGGGVGNGEGANGKAKGKGNGRGKGRGGG